MSAEIPYTDSIFDNFQLFKSEDVLSDVTFKVENESFKCHKFLLAAASEYFKTIFTTKMIEKDQKEIELKEISASAFRSCVSFIYNEGVEITTHSATPILHAACLLQLWRLKIKCEKFLQKELNKTNCAEFYKISQRYDCKDLEKASKILVFKQAEDFLTNKYNELDFDLMALLFNSVELRLPNEFVLFDSLIKWIDEDKKNRQHHFCELFKLIPLPFVEKSYFTSVVMKNDHVNKECTTCKQYVDDYIAYSLDGDKRSLSSNQVSLRHEYENGMIVVPQDDRTIKFFNMTNDSLECLENIQLPNAIKCNYSAFNNFKLFVLEKEKFHYFDFMLRKSWTSLTTIKNGRDNRMKYTPSVICYKFLILVIGGGITDVTSEVDCFVTITNIWTTFPRLQTARSECASVVHCGEVYVIGGRRRVGMGYNAVLQSVEKYSSNSSRWLHMPTLNHARYNLSAASFRNKIFVSGGYRYSDDLLSTVETYRVGDSSWTVAQSLNVARYMPGLCVLDDKMIVFGGERDEDTCLYETFNEETNYWIASECKDENVKECKVFVLD